MASYESLVCIGAGQSIHKLKTLLTDRVVNISMSNAEGV